MNSRASGIAASNASKLKALARNKTLSRWEVFINRPTAGGSDQILFKTMSSGLAVGNCLDLESSKKIGAINRDWEVLRSVRKRLALRLCLRY